MQFLITQAEVAKAASDSQFQLMVVTNARTRRARVWEFLNGAKPRPGTERGLRSATLARGSHVVAAIVAGCCWGGGRRRPSPVRRKATLWGNPIFRSSSGPYAVLQSNRRPQHPVRVHPLQRRVL